MSFSTTRAPGTRQLLLTIFLWVPVCIKKTPIPIFCWDKSIISCGATRLDAKLSHPLIAYYHMLDLLTKSPLRLVYFLRLALRSPFP